MKIKEYIYLIVVILLLGASGFFIFKYFSSEKKLKTAIIERDTCWNAPEKTIYKDTTIYTKDTTRPEPNQSLLQEIYRLQDKLEFISKQPGDTVWMEKEGVVDTAENFYSENYIDNGFRLHWEAMVRGRIKWITFPEYTYPTKWTIKTVDTCIAKPPEYKPLSFWGMELNLLGNTIDKFPNIDVGVWWSIKDRVRLEAGGQVNLYHEEVYVRLGIAIPFNKRNRK
ncbi:MAG: hypothetical protein H8E51_08610 [Bacteroidetes bacterium]|nr:hypothetical protein [Bacteroidota bacterium]